MTGLTGMKWVLFAALAVLILGAFASCSGKYGGGNPTQTTTSAPPASGSSVTLSNYSFAPASLTVARGTTVTWTNKDATTHTVSSDSGAFTSGNLGPNASFSYTFNNAGTFPYHCAIHSYMKGTITVQ